MEIWDKMDHLSRPDQETVSDFVRNPVWNELFDHLTNVYQTKPTYEYSRCVWPGWNIKFKKSGRNLCTVYPFEGYLWVLVVIGQKEKEQFEAELPFMSEYMYNLYLETEEGMGQRWLKIELEDRDRMPDVKKCIAIKSAKN